jgi:hypothetical protein
MLSQVLSDYKKKPTEKNYRKVDKKFTRLTNTIYEKASLKEGPGDRFWDALNDRADKPPIKSDCLYTYLDSGYRPIFHADNRLPNLCQQKLLVQSWRLQCVARKKPSDPKQSPNQRRPLD